MFAEPDEVTPILGGLSGLFRDYGNRDNRRRARIKFLVDEWGPEKVRKTLQEEYVDFYLKTAGEDLREEYSYNAGVPDDHGHADHVGVHEQPDGNYYVGLNVLVGRVGAEEMIEMADIAEKYGSGETRLTQRQNVILMDVPEERLDAMLDEPLLERYSPDPHPFQRGSIACTGTEFCSLSIVETKNRQVRLSRWLKENVELPDDVENFHIHLSGCTASCAQPQIADISLRGMKTRKDDETVEALDIGVGGGLGKDPSFATWIQERIAVDEVPGAIQNLVDGYAARREDGQTFREFVNTLHADELETLASPEETSYEDPYMHNTKQTWYPYAENDAREDSPAPNSPSDVVSDELSAAKDRPKPASHSAEGDRLARCPGTTEMADRVLSVTAYTTFDLLDAVAEGHGWTDEAMAVLNVKTPRKNPDEVLLQLELDNTSLDNLPAHAETVSLSPDEARKLAGELERYAQKVEDEG